MALSAAFLLNVIWHLGWSLAYQGYAPGLVTAVIVLFPVVTHVLWRAQSESWFTLRVLWSLPVVALFLHGPVLLGLLAMARSMLD